MIGDELRRTSKIAMSLCYRIERLCREAVTQNDLHDSLNIKETSERVMKDRRIVEGFYCFYRQSGDNETTALRKARANAIRVILTEELT